MRRLLLALLLLGLTVPARSSEFSTYESLTVDATTGGVGLATATLNPTARPQINGCAGRLETAQVRYRWDGTGPTASEGQLLEVGDTVLIGSHEDARRIRFIRTGATSGVLKVSCWP